MGPFAPGFASRRVGGKLSCGYVATVRLATNRQFQLSPGMWALGDKRHGTIRKDVPWIGTDGICCFGWYDLADVHCRLEARRMRWLSFARSWRQQLRR